MSIIRLTDIVTTMKSKWTYGDKFFGYTDEFNDNHDTQYPSLLITPPDSVYPEASPKNGWEDYSFEVYFSDLYNRTDQQNESIEQRWDNLQDLANEWLDMFLKSYIGIQAGKTTLSYLTDGSLTIERKKEVANDQMLQLKMNFGYRIFSKCFAPVSNYPNEINRLITWIRADSNVTFSIPTKKVSVVGDGSGHGNGVTQSTSSLQPLRYTYGGGALDKTMFTFDTDFLVSDNNFTTGGGTGQDFSIFEVSKINAVNDAVFGYYGFKTGNLIVNGDFATDLVGWFIGSSDATHTVTWTASGARFQSGVVNPFFQFFQNVLTALKTYQITCDVAYSAGSGELKCNTGGVDTPALIEGSNTLYSTPTASGIFMFLAHTANVDATISNVSVREIGGPSIEMGTNSAGNYEVSVSDGTTVLTQNTGTVNTNDYHIGAIKKSGDTIDFYYYDSLNSIVSTYTDAAFDLSKSFEDEKFRIGGTIDSDGLIPPALINARYLDGNFQEFVVWDRKLTDGETAKVLDYLNKKYNIY